MGCIDKRQNIKNRCVPDSGEIRELSLAPPKDLAKFACLFFRFFSDEYLCPILTKPFSFMYYLIARCRFYKILWKTFYHRAYSYDGETSNYKNSWSICTCHCMHVWAKKLTSMIMSQKNKDRSWRQIKSRISSYVNVREKTLASYKNF